MKNTLKIFAGASAFLLLAASSAFAETADEHFMAGKSALESGEPENAEASFVKAIELDGTVAEYYTQLGTAMINKAQGMNMFKAGAVYMRALDQYKKAISIDNDNLGAHIGLCRYYWNAPAIGGGSIKKAHIHATEVARVNPYLGHIEHALLAQKEKKTDTAISHFKSAIEMNGNDAGVHFDLAKLYQATGSNVEAKAEYEAVLAIDSEHADATAALAAL